MFVERMIGGRSCKLSHAWFYFLPSNCKQPSGGSKQVVGSRSRGVGWHGDWSVVRLVGLAVGIAGGEAVHREREGVMCRR